VSSGAGEGGEDMLVDEMTKSDLYRVLQHTWGHESVCKAKRPFETESEAKQWVSDNPLVGIEAYSCVFCGKWHVGLIMSEDDMREHVKSLEKQESEREVEVVSILDDLREFLAQQKPSVGGGWPEVTPEEMEDLRFLFQRIARAKFEPDESELCCAEIHVIDRTRFERQRVPLIPYSHKMKDANEREELDVMHTLALRAASMLDSLSKRMQGRLNDLREDESRDD